MSTKVELFKCEYCNRLSQDNEKIKECERKHREDAIGEREVIWHEKENNRIKRTICCIWKGEKRYVGVFHHNPNKPSVSRKRARIPAIGRARFIYKLENNLVLTRKERPRTRYFMFDTKEPNNFYSKHRDQEELRLFNSGLKLPEWMYLDTRIKVTGTVLVAGGDVFNNIDDLIIPKGKIPVTFNYDHHRIIGNAMLKKNCNAIMADMVIFNKEKLPKSPCYPAIQASITPDKEYNIISIGICSNNVDPRIKPLEVGGNINV